MKVRTLILSAAVVLAAVPAYALYSVKDVGDWPKSWPLELDVLRAQSRTLVGPAAPNLHFAVPFSDREQFEAAWPHLLAVKTPGAPVFLVRGENFFLGEGQDAGVVVHCPPERQSDNAATPEKPIAGVQDPHLRWMNTKYLELVVDGEVVDLNRIELPKDTPIIDERFKEEPPK